MLLYLLSSFVALNTQDLWSSLGLDEKKIGSLFIGLLKMIITY